MSAEQAVISRHDQLPTEPAQFATPAQLLQIAVQQGADLDRLTKLMDLQDRWEANQARKAFITAMAQFKETAPTIIKDKHVSYSNKAGSKTEYDHASLAAVCGAVIEGLGKVGITHRWVPEQKDGLIRVTCILTHVAGHAESTSLFSPADDSGGKNNIQAIASAFSYLQRYTLLAATGLATADMDDDGRSTEPKLETISAKQVSDLEALISEVGANKVLFLKYICANSLSEILAESYSTCVKALEAKRVRK